ncbi:MlaE family ABC transporter permease [Marichromatium bheemlicum]|uniref:ABC transporter permease n=1 Tax=Marichromatium bheemlicum TaxID=365339 RepID=A0ABX1IBE2_9GAMM|nr:ABC transporter permease [Marichromatium bheemlicum]NKN34486.1 ABC transporter permease [Marichromatium bheemlicum]
MVERSAGREYRPARAELVDGEGGVVLRLAGDWRLGAALPAADALLAQLRGMSAVRRLGFDSVELGAWDSSLPSLLLAVRAHCRAQGIEVVGAGLPEGAETLLRLAEAVPMQSPRVAAPRPRGLARLGERVIAVAGAAAALFAFVGEVVLALGRLVRGRARLRYADFWLIVQQVGAEALPIVSLVSFLVGLILGYIGDQQLARFGARIYVADLVGLAVVMQIGALVTAIVLAGRTGAAFAAQLGSMQANEEIDALRTLGIDPVEFLVLPRLLALIAMTPLLALYADLMGILGGAFAAAVVGGINPTEYAVQTIDAVGWNHFVQGLISAAVYGAVVAVSGCLRGMQSGRDAAAVGATTTSAVVTAILHIVIAAAVLTVLFDAVGL